jgi:hypothetical protein
MRILTFLSTVAKTLSILFYIIIIVIIIITIIINVVHWFLLDTFPFGLLV